MQHVNEALALEYLICEKRGHKLHDVVERRSLEGGEDGAWVSGLFVLKFSRDGDARSDGADEGERE